MARKLWSELWSAALEFGNPFPLSRVTPGSILQFMLKIASSESADKAAHSKAHAKVTFVPHNGHAMLATSIPCFSF